MQRAEAERELRPEQFRGAEACFQSLRPIHPSEDQLVSFMRAELPGAEMAFIVRHLLRRCQRCQRVTRRLWDLGEGGRT